MRQNVRVGTECGERGDRVVAPQGARPGAQELRHGPHQAGGRGRGVERRGMVTHKLPPTLGDRGMLPRGRVRILRRMGWHH